jgi:hypothetical protein
MERRFEATPGAYPEPPTPAAVRSVRQPLAYWPTLAGLALLHVSNPLIWQAPLPGVWFPAAGVTFLLVAWLGPWAAWLAVADTLLVGLQAWLTGTPLPWGGGVAEPRE